MKILHKKDKNTSLLRQNQKFNSQFITCKLSQKNVKEKFISWLSTNNVYIFNKSTWGRAPHQCFVSDDTTDEGEPSGRGLLAFKKIQKGEKLFEIPDNMVLKEKLNSDVKKNLYFLNEYDSLAIFIIKEQTIGEKSKWRIYFEILPEEKELNLVFRWSYPDVVFLRGSKIIKASIYLKEKIKIQYSRIEKKIFSQNRLKYPESIFNIQSWEWAICLLLSRAIFLQNIEQIALVPYADFINHNPFSTSYINSKQVAFSKSKEITMYSDKDYNKFDQIFTTYGQKSNLELLILFGFILERNPFDSIELRISLSSKDSLFLKKENFLRDCEKTSQITFPIFYYKYPKELYEYLRFCLLNTDDFKEDDFSIFDFDDQKNSNLEKAVRKIIIFACEKNLKSYSNYIFEEKFFKDVNNNDLFLTKNQKIAMKQRKIEKKILIRLNINLQKETLLFL